MNIARDNWYEIDYTNWRGERKDYLIRVLGVEWGMNEYHPTPCLLIVADTAAGLRTFAAANIHDMKFRRAPA
jgi:hypothetical protein